MKESKKPFILMKISLRNCLIVMKVFQYINKLNKYVDSKSISFTIPICLQTNSKSVKSACK